MAWTHSRSYKNHLLNSIATAQGHMQSERKGLQSTTRPPNTNAMKLKDILNTLFLRLDRAIGLVNYRAWL